MDNKRRLKRTPNSKLKPGGRGGGGGGGERTRYGEVNMMLESQWANILS